jgi:plastocyanin
MSGRRRAPRGLTLAFSVLIFAAASCGDEETSGPAPDVTIRVNESNFNPASREIHVGQTVEWENRYRDGRTVTSGLGPDDPDAGLLFDEELAGYPSGEAVGGKFRFKFLEADTVHYFSRDVPGGFVGVLGGTITVIP